jgi:hypothetical protein
MNRNERKHKKALEITKYTYSLKKKIKIKIKRVERERKPNIQKKYLTLSNKRPTRN